MKNKTKKTVKVFRPWLHNTLFSVATLMFLVLVSINDFSLEALPLIIIGWLSLSELVYFIKKHSRDGEITPIIDKNGLFAKIFEAE